MSGIGGWGGLSAAEEERKDILEEEVQAVRERRDSLADILQAVIPLVILPQILPLFQQAMGQTLRETTVNVRVESSMAIIPIDIAASTAVVAVDIKAQTVTLNIRIVDSAVTLNVNITNSVVDVNITNNVLNVNVTNSVINVNVTNTQLNVNVTNSVINVAVQGTANINITGQNVGLYLEGTYRTRLDEGFEVTGFARVGPFSETSIITYSPVGSEVYLVEGFVASYVISKDTLFKPELIQIIVRLGVDEVAWFSLTAEKPSDSLVMVRAIRVDASYPLTVRVINRSSVVADVRCTAFMYRVV